MTFVDVRCHVRGTEVFVTKFVHYWDQVSSKCMGSVQNYKGIPSYEDRSFLECESISKVFWGEKPLIRVSLRHFHCAKLVNQ